MSSQALLDAIETAGNEQLAQLQQETRRQVAGILAEAEKTAAPRRESAYQEALRPLAAERARRLHRAEMEALKVTAIARDQVAERLLARIEARLQTLRDDPAYPAVLRRLIEEAVQTLGEKEMNNSLGHNPAVPPLLEVDGRDQSLAQEIIQRLGLEMTVAPGLTTWGGAVARSADRLITVDNTLEARLDHLKPHFGRLLL